MGNFGNLSVELEKITEKNTNLRYVLHEAVDVLRQESHAIQLASNQISSAASGDYLRFISILYSALKARGKIVLMGVGKSGIVASKISATLRSVGIPSMFIHTGECLHGDLGYIVKPDVIIIISYSGNSEDCINVLSHLKRKTVKVLSICGNKISGLVAASDAWIDGSVSCEADPNIPIPTTSTTLAMALGDAITVNLIRLMNIKPIEFAANHPGGSLGKQLSYLNESNV